MLGHYALTDEVFETTLRVQVFTSLFSINLLVFDHMLDLGRGFGLRDAGAGSRGLGSRENDHSAFSHGAAANLVRDPFQPHHFSVRLLPFSSCGR